MPTKLDVLYYEIEARTTGFGKSLDDAERRVGKLSDFIQRRPGVAAAAAAAAIISIGVAAAKMAADVEREGQKLGNVFPRVARQARGLSDEFGVAQTNVLKLFESIRERGTRTPEGLTSAATAVLQLNQALHGTPDQLEALGAALGDVRDVFHIDAGQSGTLAATLFAMTNGRVPLADFIADVQAAAPTIRAFGLSLDQVGPALIHFRESGLNTSRQVATALKDEVASGAGALRRYAGDAVGAADAQKAFGDQLERTSHEIGRTGDQVRERFNNAMIELGTKILPHVSQALENVVTLMDRMSGRAGAFQSISNIVTMGNADWLRGNSPADLRNGGTSGDRSMRWMNMRSSVMNLHEQVSDGDISLMELGRNELEALKKSLQEFTKVTQDPATLKALHALFVGINEALAAPEAGSGGGVGGSHGTAAGGNSKIAALTAQLAALSTTVGTVAIDKLQSLQREVRSALESPAGLSAAAIAQLHALDGQVTTSLGRLTQFQKALNDAAAEAEAIKERARQATAKEASQEADSRARLKDRARQADAKDQSQLIDDMQRAKDAAGKTRDNIQGQARAIDQAVEGALDLAKAFGLVDEATKNVLSNIGQVAAGIGPLVDAIEQMGGKKGNSLSQTATLIGAALPVVGGLVALGSSLFGESPGDKAFREAQEKNTEAIQELTHDIGDLGLPGVTGKGFGAALSATANLDTLGELVSAGIVKALSVTGATGVTLTGGYTNADAAKLNAYLASQGTSLKELQAMADQLGLTVNFLSGSAQETAAAFKALHDALAKVELTQFAQTFDGQMQAFQASLTLFSVHDPLGKLTRMLDVIRSGVGSPALAQAFAGIDVTSAAGRAEATRRLQDLFGQLQNGTLDPSQLGGLTGDEFLNTMTQLKDLLDQLGSASDGQSQSWVVNRSITEVRGARLESLLGSIDLWGRDTADNTALIADLLSRLVIGGGSLQPPTIGPDGRYLGGGGVTIGQLIIQVAAGVDPATGGALAAQAVVNTLDRSLGTRTLVRSAMLGEAA